MIARAAELLWGPFTVFLLFAAGIVFSMGTGFFILRHPLFLLRETALSLFYSPQKRETAISPFEALCTALAGTLGTGNMAGTAAAIALGGPGAIFWMMVCALLGMMTKAAECTLAVRFRTRLPQGEYRGGAMYYMRDGLGGPWKAAAFVFTAAMAVSALGTTAVQPYTMAAAVETAFGLPKAVTIAAASLLCARVIFFGSRGIARFCAWMTPLLCILYTGGCIAAIWIHRDAVLPALSLILRCAFSKEAAMGGAAGAGLRRAISIGFSKSTFTHEAGMGSASIVHASADARHPAAQGLLGAAEVFVDTLVICMLTALVILTAGEKIWMSGAAGIDLTMAAFRASLGVWGDCLIAVCSVLFAFSTMVSWSFEFETSMEWLFGRHPLLYRALYILPPFAVAGLDPSAVWQLVDFCTGIVVIPNVTALLLLSGVFFRLFDEYVSKEHALHRPLKSSRGVLSVSPRRILSSQSRR